MRKRLVDSVVFGFLLTGSYFVMYLFRQMNTEVIGAFKIMNEKLEDAKASTAQNNYSLQKTLTKNLDKQSKLKVQAVDSISNHLYDVIEALKIELSASIKDSKDYEAMAVSSHLLFDNNTKKGQILVHTLESYRLSLIQLLSSDFPEITTVITNKFETDPVIDSEGKAVEWLDYHFNEFPLVAVLTKLTQIQVDIETIKQDLFTAMMEINNE